MVTPIDDFASSHRSCVGIHTHTLYNCSVCSANVTLVCIGYHGDRGSQQIIFMQMYFVLWDFDFVPMCVGERTPRPTGLRYCYVFASSHRSCVGIHTYTLYNCSVCSANITLACIRLPRRPWEPASVKPTHTSRSIPSPNH